MSSTPSLVRKHAPAAKALEQRLAAFLAHCQLMTQLSNAGVAGQAPRRDAVIGAMAAAVHGVVRASLDANAIVAVQVREARALRQSLIEEGHEVALRTGDVDDPIPGLLEIRDGYGNRVDLLLGLRGMDPELLNRTRQARFGEAVLAIASREDFVAMKAFAGGPADVDERMSYAVQACIESGGRLLFISDQRARAAVSGVHARCGPSAPILQGRLAYSIDH